MAESDLLSSLNSSNFSSMQACIDDSKNNKLDISNLSTKLMCEGKLIVAEDLLYKYNDVLSAYLSYYPLKYEHYFIPQAVSLELYGSTELWYLILFFNNMSTVHQFCNIRNIKVLSTEGIYALNKIIEIESYNIDEKSESPYVSENITLKKVII